jgi:O-antigen/teichoic acid export membrane protein
MGSATAFASLITLLQMKVFAVTLGPVGVGVLAQLNVFIQFVIIVASLSINNGVIKYAAEFNAIGERGKFFRLFATGLWVSIVASVVALLGGAFISRDIALWILDDARLQSLVLIALASIPFGVLAGLFRAFLQGVKAIDNLAVTTALGPLLTLGLAIPLVYWQGLRGGAVVLLLGSAVQCLVLGGAFLSQVHLPWLREMLGFDRALMRELLRFGFSGLIIMGAMRWGNLLIRSWVVSGLGLEQNGFYQAVSGLSNQYLSLLTASMTTYSFARLSELIEPCKIVQELNNNLRLAWLILTPIMSLILALRGFVIMLAYSPEFLSAASLLPIQFVGDFFQIAAWALGLYLLPQGKVGAWFGVNTLQIAIAVMLTRILLPRWGLMGVVTAYTIAWAACAAAVWAYVRRSVYFTFLQGNFFLGMASLAIIGIVGILPSSTINTLIAILFIALWIRLTLSISERRSLQELIVGKVTDFLAR